MTSQADLPDPDQHEALLVQALRACGADEGIVYVMSTETRGRRELELLIELDVSREALVREHRSERWNRVVRPNAADTEVAVQRARRLWPHLLVVNHNGLDVPGWTAANYYAFKRRLVERFVVACVAGPHWAWSDSERRGLGALAGKVPVFALSGLEAEVSQLATESRRVDREARALLESAGWAPERVDATVPSIPIGPTA